MNSGMPGMSQGTASSSLTPLYASDFNLTNTTQAMEFLSQMLDDSILQYDGKDFGLNFWYGIVTVIALAAFYNVFWRTTLKLRTKAAAGRSKPATTTILTAPLLGTASSVFRRVLYLQFTPLRAQSWIQVPPFGTTVLILSYFGFILALEFINNDVPGAQYYAALGIRAGWLAVAQTPLLILLAGKNNLIGFVTGTAYERLNILHRWVARGFLLLAILHVGIQNYGWNKYGVRSMEWNTDTCPPTGMGAFALLLWLNLTTLAPFRNFSYEFFVVQHLLTFFGFIVAIMLHLPSTALYTRVYIWIPIGLYLFDRGFRTARSMWHNTILNRATLEPIDGEVTKVRVRSPRIKNWGPGSHVLLSIPRYGIGQSHPATIASIPSSHNGDLLFILRTRGGFTKRLTLSANTSTTSLDSNSNAEKGEIQDMHIAFVDGPYGGSQADFASFDTVLLIAGSTGITFTLSILLDLASRVNKQKLPVRRIDLVWAVKHARHTSWAASELQAAFALLQQAGIETRFKVFVTCNEVFTGPSPGNRSSKCHCSTSLGQTCCCYNDQLSEIPRCEEVPRQSEHVLPRKIEQIDSSLDCATTESGRPIVYNILAELLDQARGETGVAVCGPLGMNAATRRAAADLQGRKSGGKITTGYQVYLHVEGFGW